MANNDICVSVDRISKKFSRSLKRSFVYGARDVGAAIIGRAGKNVLRPSEFWAVRDVSLELHRGKSIGIVGLNGSGKTTLLRMISGIIRPTLGKIHVDGRIAPMLALGAGFKPVLSGRQNIFLNLSLLGVSEKGIRDQFDSIVDFAELHESIDAPLGTYSSGMRGRLGFACAVHTSPQILVVDEVLSVGDARFRTKCRNKINDLRRDGTSLLLVSHSSILVETLSDECIYMRRGKSVMQGGPREVLKAYDEDGLKRVEETNALSSSKLAERALTHDQVLGISSVRIHAGDGADTGFWMSGRPGQLAVAFQCATALEDISVNLMIIDMTHHQGETVQFMMSSRDIGWLRIKPGSGEIDLQLPHVGLRPGTYRIKLSVSQSDMHDILDVVDDVRLVVRDAGGVANCQYYQPRSWEVTGGEVTRLDKQSDHSTFDEFEDV